jgi:hypothetical protein
VWCVAHGARVPHGAGRLGRSERRVVGDGQAEGDDQFDGRLSRSGEIGRGRAFVCRHDGPFTGSLDSQGGSVDEKWSAGQSEGLNVVGHLVGQEGEEFLFRVERCGVGAGELAGVHSDEDRPAAAGTGVEYGGAGDQVLGHDREPVDGGRGAGCDRS